LKFILTFILLSFACLNSYSQQDANVKYWIIFKDKGEFKPEDKIFPGSPAYEKGKTQLTERAIKRRMKVLTEDNLIDFHDLPLNEAYIGSVKKSGIDLIAESKWLNGVSAYLTEKQLEKVKDFDFVSQIKVVNKLYKQVFESNTEDNYDSEYLSADSNNVYDYGKSLKQMQMVNVPKLHNMGITGKGILIANFDDGFDWKNHEALRNLKVEDEYDFINKDNNASYEPNQKYDDEKAQGNHGTATLSTMSGFKEGKLIGPAFDSKILLAKTEYITTETPMEEDFWLEAAEWAEAKGADIITSSLIYRDFDEPYKTNSYSYDNLDGNTAITTIAADRAAYLGIVVCQAMGNYYQTEIPSLGSAADGDSIISVGAVNYSGDPAGFTSNGPTKDGRIKPDVVAPGVGVWVAKVKELSGNNNTYEYSSGTSFSTPITAGIAALILSAHPELTPMQVRDAIRNTASHSGNPDNVHGWGVVNAYDAALYHGMIWSNDFVIEKLSEEEFRFSTFLVSKDVIEPSSVKLNYSYDGGKNFSELPMELTESINDENNSGKYSAVLKFTQNTDNFKVYFSAKDFNGNSFSFPKLESNLN